MDSAGIRRDGLTPTGTYLLPFEFCCLHQVALTKKMQTKNPHKSADFLRPNHESSKKQKKTSEFTKTGSVK